MLLPFFKRKSPKKEAFNIGYYTFSIDKDASYIIKHGSYLIDVLIKGHEQVFEQLCKDKNFELNWGNRPPEFYASNLQLNKYNTLIINPEDLYDYEIALYYMEHHDVIAKIKIIDDWILITGWVVINSIKYPLTICMRCYDDRYIIK